MSRSEQQWFQARLRWAVMEKGRGLDHCEKQSTYSKATAVRQLLQKPCVSVIARNTS